MANTPKIGLTLRDRNEPFLLSDFTNNWSILDSRPGIFPCTSKTRPVWGTNQAGCFIIETDTNRTLVWSGSRWVDPTSATGSWTLYTAPQTSVASASSATFSLGQITVLRPCNLLMQSVALSGHLKGGMWINYSILVNNQAASQANLAAYAQWGSAPTGSSSNDYRPSVWTSNFAATAPGTYSISARAVTASGPDAITVLGISTTIIATVDNGGATTL